MQIKVKTEVDVMVFLYVLKPVMGNRQKPLALGYLRNGECLSCEVPKGDYGRTFSLRVHRHSWDGLGDKFKSTVAEAQFIPSPGGDTLYVQLMSEDENLPLPDNGDTDHIPSYLYISRVQITPKKEKSSK